MAEFYDHPVTGALHFRAPAGGGTSVFDAVATEADIAANPGAYREYLAAKAPPPAPPVADATNAKPVDASSADVKADPPPADATAAPGASPQPIIGGKA